MADYFLKHENELELLLVQDQIRVDDDALIPALPGRQSSRNRTLYNPTSKASLPGKLSSRNRTIYNKKDSYKLPPRCSTICIGDIEAVRAKLDSQQSTNLPRNLRQPKI